MQNELLTARRDGLEKLPSVIAANEKTRRSALCALRITVPPTTGNDPIFLNQDASQGAFLVGERWRSAARRMVYTSLDPSTAIIDGGGHKELDTLDVVPHRLLAIAINDPRAGSRGPPGGDPKSEPEFSSRQYLSDADLRAMWSYLKRCMRNLPICAPTT